MVIQQVEAPNGTVAASAAERGSAPDTSRFSGQIQGLRAVAVISVVVYHLWPTRLSGGYVGVDVFFVISGYLITAHLLRELDATGRIALPSFWARRARRLLPAAMTVLAATAAFVVLAMPALVWAQNLGEIRAASLYVENWQLAIDAVDYLGASNAPSLVQHFWSLSVEEQFYLVQPVLLFVAFALVRSRRAVAGVLLAVVVISGVASVVLTATQPGTAYFSTGTRAWEFALGGVVAAVPVAAGVPAGVRAILAWVGLGAIAFAVVRYDASTPFPGWTAAVPVLGAALVIAAGDRTRRWGPDAVLHRRPMQRLGDWSYSIYLWHWPLLIAAPVLLGREPGGKIKLVLLGITVVLAALTKRFVEDRFRRLPQRRPLLRTFVPMLLGVALIVSATTTGIGFQARAVDAQAKQAAAALAAGSERCVGLGAIVNGCSRPYAVTATTVPAVAADDVPWNRGAAASQKCSGASNTAPPTLHACVFGAESGIVRTVALVGDSHADHLIDAMNGYAQRHGWRLITYTREGCGAIPSPKVTNAECEVWSTKVIAALTARTDVDTVVFSAYERVSSVRAADAETAWRTLRASGKTVVPLVDVPGMPLGVKAPACVAAAVGRYDPCTSPLPERGYVQRAAAALGIPAVSLNDLLCRGGRCHAVIGGLIVYLDDDHFTLSFEQTVTDVLGDRIAALLPKE